MEQPFKKGQKVVYLDRLTGIKDALDALVKDNVYTVNRCDLSETGIGTSEFYIEVNENTMFDRRVSAPDNVYNVATVPNVEV